MGDLIALLFLARELTHRAHLKTTSYAQHVALGEFYDAIVGHADSIAETYQGQFGVLLDIPLLDAEPVTDIQATLHDHLEWIAANRYTACPREQTAIHNMIDEAVAQYQTTLYKLRFLA